MSSPSMIMTFLDTPRGLIEMYLFKVRSLFKTIREQDGDNHPVLLIPGLGAAEWQMSGMRNELLRMNYDAHTWGLGRNWGERTIGPDYGPLIDKIKELYSRNNKPVTLIGWSLGGLQARLVSYEIPEMVHQVISLGSPFIGRDKATNIGFIYSLLTGEAISGPASDGINAKLAGPIPVTTISIYSKSDGVVDSSGCIDPNGYTSSIEVSGAHTGLATNDEVIAVICNNLPKV
jgi:pimeloyl-ACP methyl ester carboxylesterase